jgi:hypothetical protein
MGHFGRITSLKDLPSDKEIIGCVKKAAEFNKLGVQKKADAASRAETERATGSEIGPVEKCEGAKDFREFQLQPQKRIRAVDHRREA